MKHPGAEVIDRGLPTLAAEGSERIDGLASRVLQRGRSALSLLWEAYQCAKELQRDVWDFAVEIGEFQRTGCTRSEVRWLVCKGLVAHAREIPPPDGQPRAFQPDGGLVFDKKTCFALTETGVPLAQSVAVRPPLLGDLARPARIGLPSGPIRRLTPKWDSDRQELRLGSLIVKQFKVPADNQEKILAAFEEEQWPVRIDDPLPPHNDQLPKRRLHDTINSLNRNQKHRLIRFIGDGRGEGVRWQLVQANSDPDNGNGSNGSKA